MIIFLFKKDFSKKLGKMPKDIKEKFKERTSIFAIDPYHSILNNHALRGKYMGYRSINITGDYRAVYRSDNNGVAIFTFIDNHNNLYD